MRQYMMRFLSLTLCAVPLAACTSSPLNEPAGVEIPSQAWADGQTERALAAIPRRDVQLAQSLFDEGWSPYFSFPLTEVFGGEVGVFNWQSRAWERSSLEAYVDGAPVWEAMFSLADVPSDGASYWPRPWVNLICQNGFSSRCMVAITKAGFDEIRWLEVDTKTGVVPDNAFDLPVGRATVDWAGEDTLLVAIGTDDTDTGSTGYPLTVRRLRRGEDLSEAEIIYRGPENADEVNLRTNRSADSNYSIIVATQGVRAIDVQFVGPGDELIPLDVPVDAAPLGLFGDFAIIGLLEDWVEGARVWPAGSVIAIHLKTSARPELVLDAAQGRWVNTAYPPTFTSESVYLPVMENGVQSIYRARRSEEKWQLDRVGGGGERIARLTSGDPAGAAIFATVETALSAPTLLQIEGGEVVGEVDQSPAFFSTAGLNVERFTAKGAGGVEIPYWRISGANETAPSDLPAATILHGYGASNVPTFPEYNAEIGRLWLNRGGAYVVAQIRGGGEYGSNWYNAGYGENRGVPVRDFIAVAEDLIARGLASADRLGIDGTSDGGRLVAGAALLRPDLFAAAVSRDGAVYAQAGSSEGSPIIAQDLDMLTTPAGRALADQYWPDRVFSQERGCAPLLLTSWRGDQRVPATQSRAFAAKLLDANCDVLLIERDGGNHATIDAQLLASVYGYFSDRLALSPGAP
ncbi:MAG: prolyl oligopeptidase family serine peptidase [Pseudomonadota bacterium]